MLHNNLSSHTSNTATSAILITSPSHPQIATKAPRKLNLLEIDNLSLRHAAEIFDSFLYEGEVRDNEYVSTIAHVFYAYLKRFKFNLKTAEWSYDLTAEDLIAISNEKSLKYVTGFRAKKGRGVISYLTYMWGCTILEAATELNEWLEERAKLAVQTSTLPDVKKNKSGWDSELHVLYGLNTFCENPDDVTVILCASPQAAHAAQLIMPGFAGIATKLGAELTQIDFSPLKGRTVVIWPNHGSEGSQFAKVVSAALLKLDKKSDICMLKPLMFQPEFVVDSMEFGEIPEGVSCCDLKIRVEAIPDGYNATDAVAEGWSLSTFCEAYGKLLKPIQYIFEAKRIGNFLAKEDGIYDIKFHEGEEVITKISSLIEVTALTRDEQGKNWGLLLNFNDRDGNSHEWSMPKELLASKDEYRQVLLSRGVDIYPAGNFKLPEYLIAANPSERALCVKTIGWHGDVFILPTKSYGKSTERTILQTANARKVSPYGVKGTLNDWKQSIGSRCAGNSRLILAACAALTGPFLDAIKLENGGFHFRGESSTGKTKALTIGASIWGGKPMVKQWKTTGNAVEGLAREHSYTALFLDELAQVSPQEAGDITYTLGNGQAKARANIYGDARETPNWRLLFLSTGEISLSDHIAAGGGRVKAGQEVRLLDIPSDAGAGMGVFENIHEAENPAAFSNSLQNLAETYYGTPADTLLTRLTQAGELDRATAFILKVQTEFMQHYVSVGSHGQISRAASRFGAVAGIGEYCISIGILPWDAGHAVWGVSKCYTAWLESRGDNTASEDIRALAQVREFIERNGESRFTLMLSLGLHENNIGSRTINRAGFRRVLDNGSTEYWVLPEMFKSEMCEGFDPTLVKRVLTDNGFLELDRAGKSSISKRVPGAGNMRVYVIKPALMQTDEDIF